MKPPRLGRGLAGSMTGLGSLLTPDDDADACSAAAQAALSAARLAGYRTSTSGEPWKAPHVHGCRNVHHNAGHTFKAGLASLCVFPWLAQQCITDFAASCQATDGSALLFTEVKEVEMLLLPEHGSAAQQRQVSEPDTPPAVPGTVVDAATFVADQHPRLTPGPTSCFRRILRQFSTYSHLLPICAWLCHMQGACKMSCRHTPPLSDTFLPPKPTRIQSHIL